MLYHIFPSPVGTTYLLDNSIWEMAQNLLFIWRYGSFEIVAIFHMILLCTYPDTLMHQSTLVGSSGNSVGTRGNSVGTQWELGGNVVGVYTERVRSMYGVDRE